MDSESFAQRRFDAYMCMSVCTVPNHAAPRAAVLRSVRVLEISGYMDMGMGWDRRDDERVIFVSFFGSGLLWYYTGVVLLL